MENEDFWVTLHGLAMLLQPAGRPWEQTAAQLLEELGRHPTASRELLCRELPFVVERLQQVQLQLTTPMT